MAIGTSVNVRLQEDELAKLDEMVARMSSHSAVKVSRASVLRFAFKDLLRRERRSREGGTSRSGLFPGGSEIAP